MPSKSEERRQAAQREAESTSEMRAFYFPDIDNGVTIHATSQEEANAKAEALVEERKSSASSSNE